MPQKRRAALVVCPGRGTYNKTELGYLKTYHAPRGAVIRMIDAYRRKHDQTAVSELDSMPNYTMSLHTRGDNAAALIFACSYCDFLSIDRNTIDIVAITGNSMGWYTALACGEALDAEHGLAVANTMGGFMHEFTIGAQAIFSTVDDDWKPIPGRRAMLLDTHSKIGDLHISIELGGMILFAGAETAIDTLIAATPPGPGRFPMKLHNHGAFHSPLQLPNSQRGKSAHGAEWFHAPAIPLIDGAGGLWRPLACSGDDLWDYTLGTQVVETYDFTRALIVGLREFAPDCVILLGPGDTLGGAVAQCMIEARWRGVQSKADFLALQEREPFVLSMGRPDQRARVESKEMERIGHG